MASGYSGTPLAKKLSLKDGMRVWWDAMPDGVRDEIAAEGVQLRLLSAPWRLRSTRHIYSLPPAQSWR
jgi:hypothetical protein